MTTTTTIPDIRMQRPVELHAGCRFTWHATSAETGGAFCLAEAVVPAGCEPPLHVHAREEESFYVLDGKVRFQRGMERVDAEPGDCILLPRGIQHGFAILTPTARMLLLATPGVIEEAFRSTSTPIDPTGDTTAGVAGPPTEEEVERLLAAFCAQGVEFTGPPLPVLLAEEA
jgi:quercetin dioxygenase-like cupin family protein